MQRRHLINASVLMMVAPLSAVVAANQTVVAYSREAYDAALARGDSFLLAFNTTW